MAGIPSLKLVIPLFSHISYHILYISNLQKIPMIKQLSCYCLESQLLMKPLEIIT